MDRNLDVSLFAHFHLQFHAHSLAHLCSFVSHSGGSVHAPASISCYFKKVSWRRVLTFPSNPVLCFLVMLVTAGGYYHLKEHNHKNPSE